MLKFFSIKNHLLYGEKEVYLNFAETTEFPLNKNHILNGLKRRIIFYDNVSLLSSMFGESMFDIVENICPNRIIGYTINPNIQHNEVEYRYEFDFDTVEVQYIYKKKGKDILAESFYIHDTCVLEWKAGSPIKSIYNIPFNGEFNGSSLCSLVRFLGMYLHDKKDPIQKMYQHFRNFVSNMLYIDLLNVGPFMGYTTEHTDIVGYLCEQGRENGFNDFLSSLDVHMELTVEEDRGVKILFDRKSGADFTTVASSGTIRMMFIYYWMHRLLKEKRCTFFYINNFDNFFHALVSAELYERMNFPSYQTIFNCKVNTNIVSSRIVRPDSCLTLQDDKIYSLQDVFDKPLRAAHNFEKIFRKNFRKNIKLDIGKP